MRSFSVELPLIKQLPDESVMKKNKLMIVREPAAKVLSAYAEKCMRKNRPNGGHGEPCFSGDINRYLSLLRAYMKGETHVDDTESEWTLNHAVPQTWQCLYSQGVKYTVLSMDTTEFRESLIASIVAAGLRESLVRESYPSEKQNPSRRFSTKEKLMESITKDGAEDLLAVTAVDYMWLPYDVPTWLIEKLQLKKGSCWHSVLDAVKRANKVW